MKKKRENKEKNGEWWGKKEKRKIKKVQTGRGEGGKNISRKKAKHDIVDQKKTGKKKEKVPGRRQTHINTV